MVDTYNGVMGGTVDVGCCFGLVAELPLRKIVLCQVWNFCHDVSDSGADNAALAGCDDVLEVGGGIVAADAIGQQRPLYPLSVGGESIMDRHQLVLTVCGCLPATTTGISLTHEVRR